MIGAPLLEARSLCVAYGRLDVLHAVDLRVSHDEAVALLGANGAGKSTLFKAIVGFLPARSGELFLDGASLHGARTDRRFHRGLGYCPEGRRVFPGMTVRQNLEVAFWGSSAKRRDRVRDILDIFPALGEKLANAAWQLSGGQQQMLAIGRALMNRPRLLLLDEPSLGLSPLLTDRVLDSIRGIVANGTAVLLAEQNVARALDVCDRAYVLELGRVVQHGPTGELRESDRLEKAFLGG